MCNFRNICHSLAYRHQQNALYSKLCGKNLHKFVVVGKYTVGLCFRLSFCEAACNTFNIEPSDSDVICIVLSLHVVSTEYDVNQHVITDRQLCMSTTITATVLRTLNLLNS
jgi:hypothetical protein